MLNAQQFEIRADEVYSCADDVALSNDAKKRLLSENEIGMGDEKKKKKSKSGELSVFRFRDVERATGGFSNESLWSSGLVTKSYKAILGDGKPVVIKRGLEGARYYKGQVALTNELRILTNFRRGQQNFVKLVGFSDDGGEKLIMLEYPARGTLSDVLHRSLSNSPMCLPLRIHLAFGIAKCLKALHVGNGVVHRDITSTNIWIDRHWNPRIANFSMAMNIPWEGSMPECPMGTLGVLDPDYPKLGYLGAKVDVFGFGILILEMMSNRKVFDVHNRPVDVIKWAAPLVRKNLNLSLLDPRLRLLTSNSKVPRELSKIAAMCLHSCSCMRPSISDVVERLRLLAAEFPFPP